jgi:hypothetical protein
VDERLSEAKRKLEEHLLKRASEKLESGSQTPEDREQVRKNPICTPYTLISVHSCRSSSES